MMPASEHNSANACKDSLTTLLRGETLATTQACEAMQAVMRGEVADADLHAWLRAMMPRIPTTQELLGFVQAFMSCAIRVTAQTAPERILDTCGTGGALKVFNTSTLAALVAAAAGCPTAKHGNRSRTGLGSAETFAAMGFNINSTAEEEARMLDQERFCFCMAPRHHPGAAYAARVRKAIGVPTVFNLVGPLTNPAGALRQLLGVWDVKFMLPVAETLAARGAVEALVIHSEDGLDEISVCAPTLFLRVDRGSVVEEGVFKPEMFGIQSHATPPPPAQNLSDAVAIARGLLEGNDMDSRRDMLLLNAAVAMVVGGLRLSWKDAVGVARDMIDGRRALALLERILSNEKRQSATD